MGQLRQAVVYFVSLLRKDHSWAEFYTSCVGLIGWGLIDLTLAPEHNSSVSTAMQVLEPFPNFWSVWLVGFGLLHLVGLFGEIRMVRIVAAAALCFAVIVIGGGIAQERPWTPGLSLYAAAACVYISAMAHQACGWEIERRLRARDGTIGRSI